MKKIIGFLAIFGLVGLLVVGCKPTGAADVQELKDKISSLEESVSTLESDIEALQTSLDELKTAFDEHMTKYHKGVAPPKVKTKPSGRVKPPKKK